MAPEQWRPKPKATPPLEIDLRERLYWVQHNQDNKSYLWPAILYSGFDEFQHHLKQMNRLDVQVRSKIALTILKNCHADKKVMVARLLGRESSLDFVEIPYDSKYHMFTDLLPARDILSWEWTHPRFFETNGEMDMYMNFMGALDESMKILSGGQESSTWREKGKERLTSFQPDHEKTQARGSEQDGAANSNSEGVSSKDPKTPSVTPENTTEAFVDEQSESPANENTTFEHAAPSSATVVSVSDSVTENEECPSPTYTIPEGLNECKTFTEAWCQLCYHGWAVVDSDAEGHNYVPPNSRYDNPMLCYEDGTPGKDYFNEDTLRKYLEDVHQWKEETAPLDKATKETEPTKEISPRRRTPRRTPGKTSSANKRTGVDEDEDEFYQFKSLITFLQKHLHWVYKPAKNTLEQWAYVVGNSKGEDGVRGIDFFHEEQEVIDFCRKNNFKEQYARLLEEEASEDSGYKNPRQTRKTTPRRTTPKATIETEPTKEISAPRRTPRRTTPKRINSIANKKRGVDEDEDEDEFYQFNTLIAFLKKHLHWGYKTAKNSLEQWAYVVGDSKKGEDGVRGIDFFHEEQEVIDFCRKNNFKEQHAHLLEQEAPGFRTPPPTKKPRVI